MPVGRRLGVSLLVAATLATSAPALAVPYALVRTLTEPVPQANSSFGAPLAALGGRVLVGAAYATAGSVANAGTVSLVDPATGAVVRTFQKPSPAAYDQFGAAVAALGGDALVGVPADDTGAPDAGAVYRFDGTTGALVRTYQKPTPAFGDQLGFAVAALGPDVLVGAPFDSTDGPSVGAAYLFDGATGALLQTFHNPAPASPNFGLAVAGVGATVAIGSPQDSTGAVDAGAVYLFDAATGAPLRRIQKPVPAAYDFFGAPIAMLGVDLLAAAPNDDTGAIDAGVVYLFDQAGTLLRSFQRPTPGPGAYFGQALAAVGTGVLVGAPKDSTGQPDAGAAYLFDGTSGALLQTLQRPVPIASETMGLAVAALGTSLVVGTSHDGAGVGSGAVLVFAPCGDGATDPGEQCDPGTTTGTCCSATCTVAPDDAPCEDGDACTAGDHCAAGACIAGDPVVCGACLACEPAAGCVAAPATGCIDGSSALVMRSGRTHLLRWRWRSSAGLAKDTFGTPTSTTGYDLCVYTEPSDSGAAAFTGSIPTAGTCGSQPCWRETGIGFAYNNAAGDPDGLSRVRMRSGIADQARILIKGRGPKLRTPVMPLATPLTVQLRRTDGGACWTSTVTRPSRNAATVFRGHSD